MTQFQILKKERFSSEATRATQPSKFEVKEAALFARALRLFVSGWLPSFASADLWCTYKGQIRRGGSSCMPIGQHPTWKLTVNHTPTESFPLFHRGDLPAHERQISADSLRMLREGLAAAQAGKVSPVPASVFEEDEAEDK
jgi:hypothetical protein